MRGVRAANLTLTMSRNAQTVFYLLGGLMFSGFFCAAKAQNPVPCLIFSGNADTEHSIDLAEKNRIYVTADGMKVSSRHEDPSAEVLLPFSNYHRFRIGMRIPDTLTETGYILSDGSSSLVFLSDTKSIFLKSVKESVFSIGIYNLSGVLIASSAMHSGQSLSLEPLPAGMYIATASDGETNLMLKFIIH